MLNEEKVIMMTRMASYEEGKGKEHIRIGRYFRSDYVALSIIKAIFAVTISFIFGLAIYIAYNFEDFMERIYEVDLLPIVKGFVRYYLIALIVYVAISYLVCMGKYIIARRNIGKYQSNLKKLKKIDKVQNKDNEDII